MSATARSPVTSPAPAVRVPEPAPRGRDAQDASGNAAVQDDLAASPGRVSYTPTLDLLERESEGEPSTDLEGLFDAIREELRFQHELRGNGLTELEPQLNEGEQPSLALDLLVATGSIALGAATAGIGGAVASLLIASSQKLVYDAVKKAVDQALKSGVEAAAGATRPDEPSARAFVRTQGDALCEAGHMAIRAFNTSQSAFKRSPDGLAEAQAFLAAVEQTSGTAKDVQETESAELWCVYLAQSAQGVGDAGGTNLAPALHGSLSADLPDWLDWLDSGPAIPGVLQLEIEGGPPSEHVRILAAHLEGVGPGVRERLDWVPLDQLNVPMEAHGWVHSPTGDRVHLAIGYCENGTVWSEYDHAGGLGYLAARAGFSQGPGQALAPDPARFVGARVVFETDIRKAASLHHLGVPLDG